MKPSRIKIIVLALVLLWFGAVVFYFISKPGAKNPKTPVAAHIQPPDRAVQVVSNYLQARENSVGADQKTPNDWLETARSLTTPNWFAKIQPKSNVQAGGVPQDYRTAHQKGYVVLAQVTNCTWDDKDIKADATAGTMHCELSDSTLNQSDRIPVDKNQLPFGWSRNGPQQAPGFLVTKQSGTWLIDNELIVLE